MRREGEARAPVRREGAGRRLGCKDLAGVRLRDRRADGEFERLRPRLGEGAGLNRRGVEDREARAGACVPCAIGALSFASKGLRGVLLSTWMASSFAARSSWSSACGHRRGGAIADAVADSRANPRGRRRVDELRHPSLRPKCDDVELRRHTKHSLDRRIDSLGDIKELRVDGGRHQIVTIISVLLYRRRRHLHVGMATKIKIKVAKKIRDAPADGQARGVP